MYWCISKVHVEKSKKEKNAEEVIRTDSSLLKHFDSSRLQGTSSVWVYTKINLVFAKCFKKPKHIYIPQRGKKNSLLGRVLRNSELQSHEHHQFLFKNFILKIGMNCFHMYLFFIAKVKFGFFNFAWRILTKLSALACLPVFSSSCECVTDEACVYVWYR